MPDVDSLRAQLKDRGYLTHGIERWFALDPWSSRAFWVELTLVALKAATLIAAFAALPMTAVMLFRDAPLSTYETLALFVTYAAAWLVVAFALVVLVALVLKLRPALPIDTPRALLAISLAAAALLVLLVAFWWSGFDTAPSTAELVAGAALIAIFLVVATIVVSAALLSFSIYELQRVPAIHQKPRTVPMAAAAAVLIALLFVPAYAERERDPVEPMVVTTPTSRRVALIAVDGLTYELVQSRPELWRALTVTPVRGVGGDSTTERWASLGTGVPTDAHGVRAIEGVRFRGGRHILQRVSRADVVLMEAAPALKLARREPLPPTVRRREYVWEIVAGRGVPSVAVNWWTTADERKGALTSIGPESIFASARGDALRLDALATSRFLGAIDRAKPRLATVYLPALDVILNRIEIDRTAQLAQSIRAIEGVAALIAAVRARGYDVVLAGLPGDRQLGSPVIASTLPLQRAQSAWDVSPTLLDLLGFPLSQEMPGRSLAGTTAEPRIASYGNRATSRSAQSVNEEYYDNLKSLGYIQ
ncbi:MAG TPA: alkaline phosphatase family protein [Thermoanaerobaculia bacterium]|nr:alkaline phosphatase family protein [Thermoanaerobaculia bacterium]